MSPSLAETSDDPSLVLVLKWGGELTPAGRVQAEELGKIFRCMYPGGQGKWRPVRRRGVWGLAARAVEVRAASGRPGHPLLSSSPPLPLSRSHCALVVLHLSAVY